MIRVVIADDQDLVRAGLRALLSNDAGISVVAEVSNGAEAVTAVRTLTPDVVLMDLRMPGTDGIEATRLIRADRTLDGTRVLVLTTFDDTEDIVEATRAGAAGYLLKDTPGDELRRAVHVVDGGGNLLSPTVARRVMEQLATRSPATSVPSLDELTDRELAVLRRIAHGETNAEIGRTLHVSAATARTYVSRILAKLGARDRTELAIIAHRAGLYE